MLQSLAWMFLLPFETMFIFPSVLTCLKFLVSVQHFLHARLSVISGFRAECWLFSEKILEECTGSDISGTYFWTAGQRIDPNTNSTFVWRLETGSDMVFVMTYTNWSPGNPSFHENNDQAESCMHLMSGRSYTWNDLRCNLELCAVCEINLWV